MNTQDGDFCEAHSVGKGDCEDNPWAIKRIKTRDKWRGGNHALSRKTIRSEKNLFFFFSLGREG